MFSQIITFFFTNFDVYEKYDIRCTMENMTLDAQEIRD